MEHHHTLTTDLTVGTSVIDRDTTHQTADGSFDEPETEGGKSLMRTHEDIT